MVYLSDAVVAETASNRPVEVVGGAGGTGECVRRPKVVEERRSHRAYRHSVKGKQVRRSRLIGGRWFGGTGRVGDAKSLVLKCGKAEGLVFDNGSTERSTVIDV